jgi:DNA-directed RNA polymerase specialized sigma subunit
LEVPYIPIPKGQVVRESYGTSVPDLTAENLKRLYEEDLLTDAEIGAKFGVSDVLVSQHRRLHGIRTLTFREREERKNPSVPKMEELTKEVLAELYLTKTDAQIGTLYGVSKVTIRNRRNLYGIQATRNGPSRKF